jgi:hypothetical protein
MPFELPSSERQAVFVKRVILFSPYTFQSTSFTNVMASVCLSKDQ